MMNFFLILINLVLLNVSMITGSLADRNRGFDQKYTQPVAFTEQGIEFFVFPDGQMELNIPPSSVKMGEQKITEVYLHEDENLPYGNGQKFRPGYVKYNRLGQPVKVGPVKIEYHKNSKVARIGDILLNYQNGRLDQVGDLKIHYDRHGQIEKYTGRICDDRETPMICRDRNKN